MFRAIGSVVVTGLGSLYLVSGEKPKPHGDHDDHHSAKHEEHEEEEEEASTDDEESKSSEDSKDEPKEEPKEESEEESKDEPKEESKDEKSDDSGSDSEGADTPGTSDDDDVVGEDETNVKKSIQDAKGGFKKRLESKNSIKQGEEKDTADSPIKDKVRIFLLSAMHAQIIKTGLNHYGMP